jgi:hypothetical protein
MPFVNVPSTNSADYINSQNKDFQDTYYVDNLNTLGGGGGGGGVEMSHLSKTTTVQSGGTSPTELPWSEPDIIASGVIYEGVGGGQFTFSCAGEYLVDFCVTAIAACGADLNSSIAAYDSTGCACSTNTTAEIRNLGVAVQQRIGATGYVNVAANDYIKATVCGSCSWQTCFTGGQSGIITITKLS